ncbi:hypothetical protein [uncultured Ruegeria sp.]|uniref:hypothetical protein n=1 Tax=uncultured Ruegeria sp. TaxID=259304 RepID=UPI00262A6DD9|nr:hypothetical protein [uncultured Ruegeria sp.]
MVKLAAASIFLAIASTTALAYSGPQSLYLELECTIFEKCDHQFLCKKTNESTSITYTFLVYDLEDIDPIDRQALSFLDWQEETVWVDFINPKAGKLPLPVWYAADLEYAPEVTFRLQDWLAGAQSSPYGISWFAFVVTSDLYEVGNSRANSDRRDDLPFEVSVYRKLNKKYAIQNLNCDSGWY